MKNLTFTKILEENWDALKKDLQAKWDLLDDNELEKINGSYKKLLMRIQKLYGYSVTNLQDEVTNFFEMSKFDKMKASAMKKINDVKEIVSSTLDDYFEKVQEKTHAAEEIASEYIKENPFKVVGAVAATGLILGYLLGKK